MAYKYLMGYLDGSPVRMLDGPNGASWALDDRNNIMPWTAADDAAIAADFSHQEKLKNPTTLAEAREGGFFGPHLRNDPSADAALAQLFAARGLTEEQGVQAAISGLKAHEATFGQGYTTASSLAGIFNDFILPAAGVGGIQGLEDLPGWSRADAEARGNRARTLEHGGDFGNNTFLGQILGFQSNLGGNIVEALKNDPERIFLGINTPLESAVWGTALGKDYDPTVNMFGGATNKDAKTAAEKGIDPQSGMFMHQLAQMFAGGVAGSAGYGAATAGANAANGALSNGQITSDSLTAALPYLASMAASYAAPSSTGSANSGIDWNNTYAANDVGTMNDAGPQTGGSMEDFSFDGTGVDMYGNPTGEFAPSTFTGDTSNAWYSPDTGGSITSGILSAAAKYGPAALKFIQDNKGLIGGLLGAAAGSTSASSKPAGTTTTTQDIPEWLRPYVQGNVAAGSQLLSTINPNNPLLGQAEGEVSKTIGGGYLDPNTNPYLKSTYDQAAKSVTDSYLSTTQPRTDALFSKGGAFGNGNSAYMETVARNQFGLGNNLKDLATNIYGGNYNAERARQAQLSASAPQFVAQTNDARFSPFKSFQTLFPNVSATTTPYFSNPLGGALSGAMAGYGLGKAFG